MPTKEEKREAYRAKCRATEAARCAALGVPTFAEAQAARKAKRKRSKPAREPRPAYGSQQWAETFADDLGESHD